MLLPVDDPAVMKFAAQAMADWETFLLQRSRELVPGIMASGALLIITVYLRKGQGRMFEFIKTYACYY